MRKQWNVTGKITRDKAAENRVFEAAEQERVRRGQTTPERFAFRQQLRRDAFQPDIRRNSVGKKEKERKLSTIIILSLVYGAIAAAIIEIIVSFFSLCKSASS